MRKLKTHNITGTIVLKTGTRIGGSDDLLQIGGTDLTCIKHPVTLQPYIPGSSLKGKMRCELERKHGLISGGNQPYKCEGNPLPESVEYLLGAIFGPHFNPRHELGPTRIIVRDASLKGGGELELKTENIIDRKVGTAQHPRKLERVVAGSTFNLEIALQEWDLDANCSFKEQKGGLALVEFVKDGLREVQNTGLGSGVSRGSGQIEFQNLQLGGVGFNL